MALEACFQLTPTTATRTYAALHTQQPKKLNLVPVPIPINKEPKRALSTSYFPSSRRQGRGTNNLISRATNAVDEVLEVSDDGWNELVIENKTPLVVVDFWAPSCGPCRMIEPIMDELAKEYAGKIACYKMNTDDNLKMASRYGIRSIPTILFFENGELKESVTGLVKKSAMCAIIDKYV